MQLQHLPLSGPHLTLEPYADTNKSGVQAALNCDDDAWNLYSLCGKGEHFAGWWQRLTDAIRHNATQTIIGTSGFLNLKLERQTLEIGGSFIAPEFRSGFTNPESKLLLLSHAFDSGIRRVEFLTDARNLRSQAALNKLGALREGIARRDRVTWTGHIRDSVVFAITDLEWPGVREALQQRIR